MKIRMGYPVSTKTGERVAFKSPASAVFDENGVPVSDRLNNSDLFKHAQKNGYTGTNEKFNNEITNAIIIDESENADIVLPESEINDNIVSGSMTWSSKKVNNQITNLNNKLNINTTKTDKNTTKLTSIESRLSAALNSSGELAEGDTSELHDIRTTYDGITHTTAGDAVRSQVENAMNKIKEAISESLYFDSDQFINGTYNFYSDGSFSSGVVYRVSSKGILKFNHDLYITCDEGFTTNIGYYDEDGNFTTNMDTAFERIVPANQPFKISIFRTPETDTTSTANIDEFVNAVKLQNYVTKNIEDLKNTVYNKMANFVAGSFSFVESDFINGSVQAFSDGNINNKVLYRICDRIKKIYPYDITVTALDGFRFFVTIYNEDNTVLTDDGYKTNYTIPANSIFRITILRVTEDTTETADIHEFVTAITVKSNLAVLNDNKLDKSDITQKLGNDNDKVVSQKMVTELEKDRVNLRRHIRCVGSSIWWYDGKLLPSNGYRGNVFARGYQTLLKERYYFNQLSNYCYFGNSLGGTTIDDTNSIINKTSEWNGTIGDVWILDTITDDFKRNIPIGTFSDNFVGETGITTYYGALKEFEKKVKELSKNNYTIIVANALRRNNDGYTSTSINAAGHTLLDYERALLNVASWNDWLFVDQYRCDITDEVVQWATIDGLHLNNFGYNLAIRPWYKCIDTLIEKTGEIVNVNMVTNKYLDGDSTSETYGMILDTVSEEWETSDYIPVTFGEKYRYIATTDVNEAVNVACVFGYDSEYTPIEIIIPKADCMHGVSFNIPDNVSYISICGYVDGDYTISLFKV